MKRRIITSLKGLLAGVLFLSSITAAMASYTATATSSTTTYIAGQSNTFNFSVKITSNATFEWVDNIVFTFPAGWTVTAATGPSPYNFCGGGQGNQSFATNVAQWVTPGHTVGTATGSGCGTFDDGTYNFTVTATAPANASGNITVVARTEGDGYPSPYTDAQIQNFNLAFAQSCGLVCPGNLLFNLDPGACSQVVNYDVHTTGVCQNVQTISGFSGIFAPSSVDYYEQNPNPAGAGQGVPPFSNSGNGTAMIEFNGANTVLTLRSGIVVGGWCYTGLEWDLGNTSAATISFNWTYTAGSNGSWDNFVVGIGSPGNGMGDRKSVV